MTRTPTTPSGIDTAGLAADLLAAYRDRRPIAPLVLRHPEMTPQEAYAVQLAQVRAWTDAGRTVRGHKVGLTSAVMQRQMGVTQPDYGHLMDDMFHMENTPVPADRYISPRVEPEIAFVLGRSLEGPCVTVPDAISAIDYVLPSLEIIDSRIENWRITLADTIADNASSGGVVLGSTPVSLEQLTARGLSLRTLGCNLHVDGAIVGTGAGGAALGSPVNALAWLANTVGPLGITLEAGSVILPGSVTAAVPVRRGSTATATFAGIGSVTATFAG